MSADQASRVASMASMFTGIDPIRTTCAPCLLALVYLLTVATYNVWFHPLAGFPGPFLARTSLLWRMKHSMSGRFHRSIQAQHERYGPVVRISPNELSFASVGSWKAIYGHPTGNKRLFLKGQFYDIYGSGYDTGCIGSEKDPTIHTRMKKSLTSAFSTKALAEQEHIISKCAEGFVHEIYDRTLRPRDFDLADWFDMVSFDTLGEMAFGESFGCVESGQPHFWPALILKHLFFITVIDNLRRFALLATLGRSLLPRLTASVRNEHIGYSRDKVDKRLKSKSARKDFLTTLVGKVEDGEISREEMTAHASTLIVAGGEAVATFLSAVTYYLLKNPEAYTKLRQEIRSRYDKYEDIDGVSAQQLPYLQAVINEGLRIFPPGSQGFPRVSPGALVDGYYVPPGTEVYTSAWTITHDPAYFHEPYQFKPERWIDPHCTDVKEASQPFSLGPRGCIGRNFALLEMALVMCKLHWMLDIELVDEDLDWEGSSHIHVLWWKPQLNVEFKRVEREVEGPKEGRLSQGTMI